MHWGIRKGLAAPRVPHHTDPGALGLAFETLRIGTENGKALHAWFIPAPGRAAVAGADAAAAKGIALNVEVQGPLPRLQADQAGTFRGQCAEFCGLNHAHMVMTVIAMPANEFEAWLARMGIFQQQGGQLRMGEELPPAFRRALAQLA